MAQESLSIGVENNAQRINDCNGCNFCMSTVCIYFDFAGWIDMVQLMPLTICNRNAKTKDAINASD